MPDFGSASIGAVLQGVGSLASAAAIVFAAWIASDTYKAWRRQKLSERRMEQAERVLTATYKARRALAFVRSPMMTAAELDTAREQLGIDALSYAMTPEQSCKASAQGYMNRLSAVRSERIEIDECLPMARALFGEEVETALDTLNHQFHLVQVAANMSVWVQARGDYIRDLSSASGADGKNPMNDLIDEKVKTIEDACLPVLRLNAP
jgi:hypothetical protein